MHDEHGELPEFLVKFNPTSQRQVCEKPDTCFVGDYPTLALLRQAYGSNAAQAWLVPQLLNLSEFCGCKDKITDAQIEELAYIIATEFFYLNIGEMMLFFQRFKGGRYGRFYGSVDPMVITTAIRDFLKERSNSIERIEREEALRNIRESSKDAISYEQYCRNHDIDATENVNPILRLEGKES